MTERGEFIELYRVMVDTITSNELRRQQINSVYITLLAAGFGAIGAIDNFDLIYAAIPAALVSALWWAQLRYLKNLADAKFHVVDQIEEHLNFKPFEVEWKYLERHNLSGWKSWFRIGLSQIEMFVPTIIFLVSIAHIGYAVVITPDSNFWSQFCSRFTATPVN